MIKIQLGRQLEDMSTRYGFTSVFDLSSLWENTRIVRDRVESGEVPGPRIRSTGEGLISASLTTAPAAEFGESNRLGRIGAGFIADLVALRGQRSMSDVVFTIRDGRIVYRE